VRASRSLRLALCARGAQGPTLKRPGIPRGSRAICSPRRGSWVVARWRYGASGSMASTASFGILRTKRTSFHWPVLIVGFTGIADSALRIQAMPGRACITAKAWAARIIRSASRVQRVRSGVPSNEKSRSRSPCQADFAAGQVQVAGGMRWCWFTACR